MKEMSTQPMTAEELLDIAGKATPGEWRTAYYPTEGTPFGDDDLAEVLALLNHAPRIIRELLARVAELEAQVTPRPIDEDAPKDEPVFVFCPEESDYGYTAAWVVGECVLDSWEGDSRLEDGVQPTHWLPLPPDPTEVTE
jgi:hypothetical protein